MEPSLDALPWMVQYGEEIGYGAIAVCAALGLARAIVLRRAAASRRVRVMTRGRITPASLFARDVEVTVRGTLRALPDAAPAIVTIAATSQWLRREQALLATAAPDALWIELDGARVELAGPVELVGARRVRRHAGTPDTHATLAAEAVQRITAARAHDLWRGPVDGYHVRTLAVGDEVLARGRLEAAPARAERGYRDEGTRWRMVPTGTAITLAAPKSAIDPPRLPLYVGAGHAVLWGSAMMALLLTIGAATSGDIKGTPGEPVRVPASAQWRAIVPGENEAVVFAWELAVQESESYDRGTVEALAALAWHRDCAQLAAVWRGHGRPDEAFEVARWCRTLKHRVGAYALEAGRLGDVDPQHLMPPRESPDVLSPTRIADPSGESRAQIDWTLDPSQPYAPPPDVTPDLHLWTLAQRATLALLRGDDDLLRAHIRSIGLFATTLPDGDPLIERAARFRLAFAIRRGLAIEDGLPPGWLRAVTTPYRPDEQAALDAADDGDLTGVIAYCRRGKLITDGWLWRHLRAASPRQRAQMADCLRFRSRDRVVETVEDVAWRTALERDLAAAAGDDAEAARWQVILDRILSRMARMQPR